MQEAEKFVDFVKRAFGAKEVYRPRTPDGSIMNAELQIGDSKIMLGQATHARPGKSRPEPSSVRAARERFPAKQAGFEL